MYEIGEMRYCEMRYCASPSCDEFTSSIKSLTKKIYCICFSKNMFFGTYIFAEKHIFFVRPLLEHGVYEKVP